MGIEQFLSSRNTCTHSFVIKHQHYSVQRKETQSYTKKTFIDN